MPNQIWSQDSFNVGEISPLMYAKTSVNQYYASLKTAKNVLCFPQGGAGKRFGTLLRNVIPDVTHYEDIFFQTFQYLNECVYQLVFIPNKILIYLEGNLTYTLTGTGFDRAILQSLDWTVIDSAFRVAGDGIIPRDLVRVASGPLTINGFTATTLTVSTPFSAAGFIYPTKFSNVGGALPTSTPQIKAGVTYFIKLLSTTSFEVYRTPTDARDGINKFAFASAGTGTNSATIQNDWTFNTSFFKRTPIYDFTGGYDAINFTLAAVSGVNIVLNASAAIFTTAHVGGAFIANGGVAQIITWVNDTEVRVNIARPFASVGPMAGSLSLLAEPAWSVARGFPQVCSSYQNRAFFANTPSLPNGIWGSTINDYTEFWNGEADADDPIAWFPSSDEVNYIKFIVPYRSLTVHTNSGIYSTPLSALEAITPTNFTLQLNDTTPADNLKPRAIDNQLLVVSGNDVNSLIWDGLNNAYTSEIVSTINEHLIRDPIDEAPFILTTRAGSRYLFLVNLDGSLATFQTLFTDGIKGWTPSVTEQSYGSSYFRYVASSLNGRAWFVVERQIATAASPLTIIGIIPVSNIWEGSGATFEEVSTACKFTVTGSLPVTSPQVEVGVYYWAKAIETAPTQLFKVYTSKEDADAGVNEIQCISDGINYNVVPWTLSTQFMIEELTFETRLDCATKYSGSPTSSISGLSRFNAQDVKMVGDGFGFEAIGNNDAVEFKAHGELVQVSDAYIGFPIDTIMQPLPIGLSTSGSPKMTTLTRPKHVRNINFIFNDTIGGTINGKPIALKTFDQAGIGEPPVPAKGYMEVSILNGWDDFNTPSFTIEHNEPFDIQLLGVFYMVDI